MGDVVKKDENGYLRGKPEHSDLISRQIAYAEIYLKRKDKYPMSFANYVVHHIDGEKQNNSVKNLYICTTKKHNKIHIQQRKQGYLFKSSQEIDTFFARSDNESLKDIEIRKKNAEIQRQREEEQREERFKEQRERIWREIKINKEKEREEEKKKAREFSIRVARRERELIKERQKDWGKNLAKQREKEAKELAEIRAERKRNLIEEQREKWTFQDALRQAKEEKVYPERITKKKGVFYIIMILLLLGIAINQVWDKDTAKQIPDKEIKTTEEIIKEFSGVNWKLEQEVSQKQVLVSQTIQNFCNEVCYPRGVSGITYGDTNLIVCNCGHSPILYYYFSITENNTLKEEEISTSAELYIVESSKTELIVTNTLDKPLSINVTYRIYSKWFGIDSQESKVFNLNPNTKEIFNVYDNAGCSTAPCSITIISKEIIY